MVKPYILASFIFGQAIALFAAGIVTLWWSGDLMRWLIWLVGEEYALGAKNVIRTKDGVFLTNPMAMIQWTLPFWFLGVLQITAALTLAWLGVVHLASRRRGRCR